MFRPSKILSLALIVAAAGDAIAAQSVAAGAPAKGAPGAASAAQSAITLAETGHCAEALPSLRKSVAQLSDRQLKRKVGLGGLHCAMTLRRSDAALDFLHVLTREFPDDPDVLYVSIHAYSDLSTLASQELAQRASSSYQARELLAESFESQGKWDEAEKEYRTILQQNPSLPGIHFRIGRILLSKPNPSPTTATDAKQEFTQELQIDPKNAGAEYVLGELARQTQDWDEAAKHFLEATKFDAQFADAFLGLGMSLIAEKRYSEALAPLEKAVKLEPRNPNAHYNLALAYTRAGRKQEGEKEFAIHRGLIGESAPAQGSPANQPQENQK